MDIKKVSSKDFRKTVFHCLHSLDLLNKYSDISYPFTYTILESDSPNIIRIHFHASVYLNLFLNLVSMVGCFMCLLPFYDEVIVFNHGCYSVNYLQSKGIIRESDK